MITGIVVALPEEISTLTDQKIAKGTSFRINDEFIIFYSGAGPENASNAAEQLVKIGAKRLISWGCAGGLNPALQPGDLILADHLIDAGNIRHSVDPVWHAAVKTKLDKFVNVQLGMLTESSQIVSTVAQKQILFQRSGADILDMESLAVAKVANRLGQPFLAIRAITDPASMDLPKAVTVSLNSEGDIVLTKLLLHLFLHPYELPGLIRLGRHFNRSQNTLKRVAKALLKSNSNLN